MLDIHRPSSTPSPKIYFTHSILPSYIDPLNVSTKKHPFATFNHQPFTHTLDLILPTDLYELCRHNLASTTYARVHMTLAEILEPEFLNTYIKQGNIAMLSEGRPLVDNRFELLNGVLNMELDKQTYERCGLVGVPIEDAGRKHQKQRWVVRVDLKGESMKHGKKGFGRLVWAARNVLDRSLTWVFWNANPSSKEALKEGSELLSKHAPWVSEVEPEVTRLEECRCPKLKSRDMSVLYEEEESLALLEYVHMLSLDSPRIRAGDGIDPHLSRYEVPDFGEGVETRGFVCVRWKGFITPTFVREVFLGARRDGFRSKKVFNGTQRDGDGDVDMGAGEYKEEIWFALSAQGFGGKRSWTTMQFEGGQTLTWETEY